MLSKHAYVETRRVHRTRRNVPRATMSVRSADGDDDGPERPARETPASAAHMRTKRAGAEKIIIYSRARTRELFTTTIILLSRYRTNTHTQNDIIIIIIIYCTPATRYDDTRRRRRGGRADKHRRARNGFLFERAEKTGMRRERKKQKEEKKYRTDINLSRFSNDNATTTTTKTKTLLRSAAAAYH